MKRALFKCSQPNRLLNHLLEHFDTESDAILAERLMIGRSTLIHARNGRRGLGPFLILSIHLVTVIGVERIMELGGITMELE